MFLFSLRGAKKTNYIRFCNDANADILSSYILALHHFFSKITRGKGKGLEQSKSLYIFLL